MPKNDFPVTPAVRLLRQLSINFVPHEYEYSEKGGTKQTAVMLNLDEHIVIKTLVMQSEIAPFIVLMHGDKEVSTKELARQLNVKKTEPVMIETALKLTGYMFGGTSPFGTRKTMKVYVEESILSLAKIFINGGKRGFIIEIDPADLGKALDIEFVNVAIDKKN